MSTSRASHSKALEKRGEIGFAVLRGGGVIGQHEVRIANDQEMITLRHDAFDRDVFAKGAVNAALWAHKKEPGVYSMKDVLNIDLIVYYHSPEFSIFDQGFFYRKALSFLQQLYGNFIWAFHESHSSISWRAVYRYPLL